MQWYQRYGQYLISAIGYVIFICIAVFSFQLFIGEMIGMDALIAFLLSQTLGMVALHFMLRRLDLFLQRRLSVHQYGTFLLTNALVILTNAFFMQAIERSGGENEIRLQIFATALMLCVNIVMQLIHTTDVDLMHDEESEQ